MKILLSAYACEPNKGSEPGVGWNWALALARRGYDIHVITRSNNRLEIERAHPLTVSRLAFHYYDLPGWLRFWKHWPGGIYLYYLLWQTGAYWMAKKLHSKERFDVVQHITFVSYRQPSFMGGLGIPFIFGPVGGGESMPPQFRESLPVLGRIAESVRDTGNRLVALDPLMQRTYRQAQIIACATAETLAAIPARFHSKCIVQRAIGIDEPEAPDASAIQHVETKSKPQFLFAGRLLYWKGLHLALRALEQLREKIPGIKLRVIGEGSDRQWLEKVAKQAKVDEMVDWIARVPHDKMQMEYQNSMGFIFPSLHDSGGMVVLEALAAGVPVICLDVGGPGSIVDSSCGYSLQVQQKSESEIIEELASTMLRLASEEELWSSRSHGARERVREMTWDRAADAIYCSPLITEKLNAQVFVGRTSKL